MTALDLPFKGGRDYLHGTDLLQALVEMTGASVDLSLRMQRMMRVGVELVPLEALEDRRQAAALFSHRERDGEIRRLAVREDGRPVLRRTPYDEDQVTSDARFGADWVELDPDPRFTEIERLVAHQKSLARRCVADVPWLFTRLDSSVWPPPEGSLKVCIQQVLGQRTVRSELSAAGKAFGSITFTARR